MHIVHAMDIQRTDNLSKFLDNHRIRTNPFGENRAGERVYRRAERISAGLYLLTSHLQESEPLRAFVRSEALKLLNGILTLKDEMRAVGSLRVNDVQASIRILISSMRLLAVAGHISPQNTEVITEALDELGNLITLSRKSELSESLKLTREELLATSGGWRERLQVPKGHSVSIGRPLSEKNVTDVLNKSTMNTRISEMPDRYSGVSHSPDRGEAILAVMRSGGAFGIRDIASSLPEYSEKMVQRELANLVHMGIVERSGNKRWSRYTLATHVSTLPSTR